MKEESSKDGISRIFYFVIPWTVPVIVALTTFLFYPVAKSTNMIWLPLLVIYETTLLTYTLVYRKLRGGVFHKERFKLIFKLKGKRLWLQYLLVYGPFIYNIPLFILNYGMDPAITVQMYVVLALASAINGTMEEVFWRACLEDAGKKTGVSEKKRLIYAPIAFALWHTAFVIHIYPAGTNWWVFWAIIIVQTWTSGISWLWVMQKSERLFPQIFYHACANFLSVFPLLLVSVLGFYFQSSDKGVENERNDIEGAGSRRDQTRTTR
ncbi:MAG: CPBP family intramembrane glutamic endopeptidase [Candidatus Hodarchaeota archaeon]